MKTQAAVSISATRPMTTEEVELKDPLAGEVRIKIHACGICRSDLSALEGREPVEFPVVLGHEAAGVVEAIDADVSQVQEGDEVILSWTPACATCDACKRGAVHLCEGINMTTHSQGPLSWRGEINEGFAEMAQGIITRVVLAF